MANEIRICCCGASTWTKVIAWFQIIGNALLLIVSILAAVAIGSFSVEYDDMRNYDIAIAALAIVLLISLLRFIMGIILLKGTNQKRVGFLRAWLIYGIAAVISSIVSIILNSIDGAANSSLGSGIVTGLLGIGINIFTVVVVYIHIREINEGVFTQ